MINNMEYYIYSTTANDQILSITFLSYLNASMEYLLLFIVCMFHKKYFSLYKYPLLDYLKHISMSLDSVMRLYLSVESSLE